jgi:archaemetzincin
VTKKIYLAWINRYLPPHWKNIIGDLSKCLPYEFSTIFIELNLQLFYNEERNQYHSTFILSEILNHLPENNQKILGVTNVDIFIPILTFLFGEAQLDGNGALLSTFRLRNEFYGLPKNDHLLYQRIIKESLHELGHTMGLVHCANFECAMNFSTSVEGIDIKKAMYCKHCQSFLGITCREDD